MSVPVSWALWGLYFCAKLVCAVDEGPQLWEIAANSRHPLLAKLQDEGDVDVWSSADGNTQVVAELAAAARIRRALDEASLEHKVVVDDMFDLIQAEEEHMKDKKRRRKRSLVEQMDWTSYHRLEDIEGYLGWLNATHHRYVKVVPVATTEEGRPLYLIKVSDPLSSLPKRKIWIEGGIHAREWISPAATAFLLHQVVTSPEFKPLLERTIWYFIPVANPDGYAYSFTGRKARMWRKNRSQTNRFLPSMCKGIDLNRNWNLKWGVGASSNPCSETYKGLEPFSEPETNGLRNAMEREGPIDVFITFHSYGQSVLYPWGWTHEPPENKDQLWKLGKRFVEAVRHASKGKTTYNLGGSADVYGLASGASDDWSYGFLGTPYSYTIELRDNGKYGFLLPENQIIDTVQETTIGVYCMVSYLVDVGICAKPENRVDIEPRRSNSKGPSNRVIFEKKK